MTSKVPDPRHCSQRSSCATCVPTASIRLQIRGNTGLGVVAEKVFFFIGSQQIRRASSAPANRFQIPIKKPGDST
jgi:hypothetical protein